LWGTGERARSQGQSEVDHAENSKRNEHPGLGDHDQGIADAEEERTGRNASQENVSGRQALHGEEKYGARRKRDRDEARPPGQRDERNAA
jgi:hypothetical protein